LLEWGDAEDALYAAAEPNGLVADDGRRQTWAKIRSERGAALPGDDQLSWPKSRRISHR
jgi:hypothetical protein